MKIAINNLVIFCVIVLFCGQAVAQTNNLKGFCRYGKRLKDDGSYLDYKWYINVLPVAFFPWGVCFYRPSFISSDSIVSVTSSQEDEWTREAMQIWNTKYRNYKINRWGNAGVVGIPKGPLFVKSCDRYKHNIIYTFKDNLAGTTLGMYSPVDDFWDFKDFYAIIRIDSHNKKGHYREWNKAFFINVMTHELGHGLALPHMDEKYSQMMVSSGFGRCKKYKTSKVCQLTDYDIERFLWPYDPPSLAEHQRQQEMARLHDERQMRWYETGCPQFSSIGGFGSRGRPLVGLCP